ncbi:S41 family peptidase [Ascidiimonas aurantiaca]|uniref:S41 family peptidase n=1 Tax=Ascidiimonas aurantiaca TaxID=1685432 RepID=UPI0030EC372D
MNLITKLSLLFSLIVVPALAQAPLVHFPSISPDGQMLAFNYQGDIWIANVSGINVRRLTIHEAYDTNPVWSHDGSYIAFQSNRYGNNDVYTIPVNGGVPKRFTYHSGSDVVTDITKQGDILFNTRRYFAQVEREPEVYLAPKQGGTPYRYMNALGFDAVVSPNGRFVALTKGSCRLEREAYRGPANRDIWIYDTKNNRYTQLTTDEGNDFYPQWVNDQTLYFQSGRSGKYNVHRISLDQNGQPSGAITQVTQFKEMGIFSFNVNRNGEKMVCVQGDQLHVMDISSGNMEKVSIQIGTDYRFDPKEKKTFSNQVSAIVPSPDNKYSIFEIRGELFLANNDKEKKRTVNLSNSPYRDSSPVWIGDNSILFVSDREGSYDLYSVSSSDPDEKNLYKSLKREVVRLTKTEEDETQPVLSPDGKKLAFVRGSSKLIVANVTEKGTLTGEKVLLDNWAGASGVAWSPDSQWLAYASRDLDFNQEIFIHKADNSKKPVNISMHPKQDVNPVWSPDGKKLGFSSNRNNGDYDVWFTWLLEEDWEKTKEDREEDEDTDTGAANAKDAEKDKNEAVVVNIDFENIHERQIQVTSYTGGEFLQAFSKDAQTLYYTTGLGSRGNAKVDADLFSINWDGKERKSITSNNARPSNVTIDSKNSHLYFTTSGGSPKSLKMGKEKPEALSFTARMTIDYYEESNQIFEEAWNAINNGFYDPKFHGKSWKELKATYKPLAMKASTRDDFKTVFNWMLGQVNASHMGMYRGEERADLQKESTGLLGVEVKPDSKGKLEVLSVVEGMPASRKASRLNIGDVILGVNGEELKADTNIYSLLTGTAGQKIYLTVQGKKGEKREVVIRPKSGNRLENYKAWVNERKRLTEVYSNGKLGYIHIQGMNWPSFESFERELTAAGSGKEGIVIDVRYNGGGWTTDYLMAVLSVKQHAYTVPRGAAKDLEKENKRFSEHYPFSERLPLASWTKPSIALCNETSYSNAEIFSHAYKSLDIGTLVGMPTFGAVISTGARGLIDGSIVRMPFRGWYVKSTGENMELGPAVPDIVLDNAPDDKANGKDVQLKKAVDTLLEQLEK